MFLYSVLWTSQIFSSNRKKFSMDYWEGTDAPYFLRLSEQISAQTSQYSQNSENWKSFPLAELGVDPWLTEQFLYRYFPCLRFSDLSHNKALLKELYLKQFRKKISKTHIANKKIIILFKQFFNVFDAHA